MRAGNRGHGSIGTSASGEVPTRVGRIGEHEQICVERNQAAYLCHYFLSGAPWRSATRHKSRPILSRLEEAVGTGSAYGGERPPGSGMFPAAVDV